MVATKSVTDDAVAVLARSAVEGNVLRLPAEQLDRKLYGAVDKALKALGGKWNKKSGGHIFPEGVEVADMVAEIVETGKVVDERQKWQFFETPRPLAERMVDLAAIDKNDRVLEPSAGLGAIANAIRDWQPSARVVLVEQHPTRVQQLCNSGRFPVVLGVDFLTTGRDETFGFDELFDRIVMNPPFSRRQDAKHFLHAWGLLSPGGRIVCVMAGNAPGRQDAITGDVQAIVEEHGYWESIPDGTFKASGTGVSAVLAVADKPAA